MMKPTPSVTSPTSVIRTASVVETATISMKSGFAAFTLVMMGLKSSVFTA